MSINFIYISSNIVLKSVFKWVGYKKSIRIFTFLEFRVWSMAVTIFDILNKL